MSESKFETKRRQAYINLRFLNEEVNRILFEDTEDTVSTALFGPTVRDAIAGGIVDELWVSIELLGKTPKFIKKLIVKHFVERLGEPISCDFYEMPEFFGKFEIKTKFGPKILYLWSTVIQLNWTCDNGMFQIKSPSFIGYYGIQNALETNEIHLAAPKEVTVDNVQQILLEGANITKKYGWVMSADSIQHLNRIVEKSKPLEEHSGYIYGFRAYSINAVGRLVGARGVSWNTSKLTVDCPDFLEHIKSAELCRGGDNYGADGHRTSHACGIHIYKDPIECLFTYDNGNANAVALVVAWGNIWEGERGYLAEHVRIERLWVFDTTKHPLAPDYEVAGGVVVGATRTDLMHDLFSRGVNPQTGNPLIN